MSYEGKMLERLAMPSREEVRESLLRALLRHGGAIREFGAGSQEVVDEIAGELGLSEGQRSAVLKTVYRKENRPKISNLWNRLLFRVADSAAKDGLVSRPTQTIQLTRKREWMLTEEGFEQALRLSNIPVVTKNHLPIKSFEVQKIVKKLNEASRPLSYNPVNKEKRISRTTRESVLRTRGFRQAVIEAYDYQCSVCGLKMTSPGALSWEVEAAYIVPNRLFGRDDIWNGLALCRFHHWAFDVGWFTLRHDFTLDVNDHLHMIPPHYGLMESHDILRQILKPGRKIRLPDKDKLLPHENSISWHRINVFMRLY